MRGEEHFFSCGLRLLQVIYANSSIYIIQYCCVHPLAATVARHYTACHSWQVMWDVCCAPFLFSHPRYPDHLFAAVGFCLGWQFRISGMQLLRVVSAKSVWGHLRDDAVCRTFLLLWKEVQDGWTWAPFHGSDCNFYYCCNRPCLGGETSIQMHWNCQSILLDLAATR